MALQKESSLREETASFGVRVLEQTGHLERPFTVIASAFTGDISVRRLWLDRWSAAHKKCRGRFETRCTDLYLFSDQQIE